MSNTNITLSEVYASTYSTTNGKLINQVKIKTLSKLQTILNELGITSRNSYLKALRLVNAGKTIPEAVAAIAGGTNNE